MVGGGLHKVANLGVSAVFGRGHEPAAAEGRMPGWPCAVKHDPTCCPHLSRWRALGRSMVPAGHNHAISHVPLLGGCSKNHEVAHMLRTLETCEHTSGALTSSMWKGLGSLLCFEYVSQRMTLGGTPKGRDTTWPGAAGSHEGGGGDTWQRLAGPQEWRHRPTSLRPSSA